MTNTEEDTDVENILHSDRFEVEEDSGLLFWLFRGPNTNFTSIQPAALWVDKCPPGGAIRGKALTEYVVR